MAFPGRRSGGLQPSSPILLTANGATASIPSNAGIMHAFIVAGGGSGGAASNSGSTAQACGGGSGGALYFRVNLMAYRGNLPRNTRPQTVTATAIGAGGLAVSTTGFAAATGNTGGSTTISISGGFSVTVTGGVGGVGSIVGGNAGGAGGSSSTVFNISYQLEQDPIIARPLWAAPSVAPAAYSGDGGFSGGSAGASGDAGGSVSASFLAPWWLQAAGLTPGTGGTGATNTASARTAGGGGGGWGGNGGNAVASSGSTGVTAGSGTGYGSGGGGVQCNGNTGVVNTSGAGAPGCIVIMFEVEV